MSDALANQYYIMASSVVFYYDFVLTFPQEVKHIWGPKFTSVNVLLIALRYTTAFGYIPVLLLIFAPALLFHDIPEQCGTLISKLPGILGIVCQALTLAFLIIRIFAIYDKKRWILYTTVPLGLSNVALSSLAIASATVLEQDSSDSAHADDVPCFVTPSLRESMLCYELSYIAIILFDTWIFVLSVTKMGNMYREKRLFHSESSIVNILLRDGIILYSILTINNAFNFLAFMLAVKGRTWTALFNFNTVFFVASSGTNSELTHALSTILVSRMIFNLREAGTEIYEGTEEWRSRVERVTKEMQFHVPTTIHEDGVEIREDLDGQSGAEVFIPVQGELRPDEFANKQILFSPNCQRGGGRESGVELGHLETSST